MDPRRSVWVEKRASPTRVKSERLQSLFVSNSDDDVHVRKNEWQRQRQRRQSVFENYLDDEQQPSLPSLPPTPALEPAEKEDGRSKPFKLKHKNRKKKDRPSFGLDKKIIFRRKVVRQGVQIRRMRLKNPGTLYVMVAGTCLAGFIHGFNDRFTRKDDADNVYRRFGWACSLALVVLAFVTHLFDVKKRIIYLSSGVLLIMDMVVMYLMRSDPASEAWYWEIPASFGFVGCLLYVAESSPAGNRGCLLYLVYASRNIGSLVYAVLARVTPHRYLETGLKEAHNELTGAKEMRHVMHWWYLIPPFLAVVHVLLLAICPRSPSESLADRQVVVAWRGMEKFIGEADVRIILPKIQRTLRDPLLSLYNQNNWKSFLRMVNDVPHIRKTVLICLALRLVRDLVDTDIWVFYNKMQISIIQYGQLGDARPLTFERYHWILLGTTAASIPLAFFCIESIGRRNLLICSYLCCFMGFLMTGVEVQAGNASISNFVFSKSTTRDECSNYSTCGDCVRQVNCSYCYTNQPEFTSSKLGFCFEKSENEQDPHQCTFALDSEKYNPNYNFSTISCPPSHPQVLRFAIVLLVMGCSLGVNAVTEFYVVEAMPTWLACTVAPLMYAVSPMMVFLRLQFLNYLQVYELEQTVLYCRAAISFCTIMFISKFVPDVTGAAIQDTDIFFMKGSVIKSIQQEREKTEKKCFQESYKTMKLHRIKAEKMRMHVWMGQRRKRIARKMSKILQKQLLEDRRKTLKVMRAKMKRRERIMKTMADMVNKLKGEGHKNKKVNRLDKRRIAKKMMNMITGERENEKKTGELERQRKATDAKNMEYTIKRIQEKEDSKVQAINAKLRAK